MSQTRGASSRLPKSAALLPFCTAALEPQRREIQKEFEAPPSELVPRMRIEVVGLVNPLLWTVDDSGPRGSVS